jgi:VIT1/CCC1 family predicted Fe2+/Mn2+ transporter
MTKPCKTPLKDSIREIIFGLEDSLVTSLGTVTGVAAATQSAGMVIISGVVVVCVSTLSMSAGSYLSSKTAASVRLRTADEKTLTGMSLKAALVMGVSYLLGGFIPIIPYFFDYFITKPVAIVFFTFISVVITALTLFFVGVWSAGCTKRHPLTSGIEMLLVSLGAAFVGALAGSLVHKFLAIFAGV